MRLKTKFLILLLVFLVAGAAMSVAQVNIPSRPVNHVVDLAGIIDPNVESNLNQYLLELEQKIANNS